MNVKAQKAAVVRCYGTGGNEGRSGYEYRSRGESMKHWGQLLRMQGVTVSWLHYGCIGAALDGAS